MPTEYDNLSAGQLQLKIAQLEQSMEAEIQAIKFCYESKLTEMRKLLHRKLDNQADLKGQPNQLDIG